MTSVHLDSHDDLGAAVRVRLAGFVRSLRDSGYKVGLGETEDAIWLLRSDVIKRPQRLKEAFRALFCGRLSDWTKFDEVFDAYWLGRGVKSGIKVSGSSSKKTMKTIREMVDAQGPRQDTIAGDVDRVPGEEDDPSDETPSGRREGASIADHLGKTDFRNIHDPEQMAKAHELAEKLARAMRIRLTRRDKQKRKGPRLDLRKTIRHSIAHGGTPIELIRKGPRARQLRLVILLDASGSMSNYTGVFTRFVHGLIDNFREAEAFSVPHPACPCLIRSFRTRRNASDRPDGPDGPGHRRRDEDRRGAVGLQQVPRCPRHSFPHLRDDPFRRL
jgi:uncharacterized protein with von Willebrand factor type A (vWA) domain